MVLPLRFAGDPILYKKTKDIPPKEIKSAKIQAFLRDLGETISHYRHAAGLAAPQVGKNLRIFALKLDKKSMSFIDPVPNQFAIPANEPFFFINPKLTFPDPTTESMGEGCLSIPYYHVFVERYIKAHVSAYTQAGTPFSFTATGIFARYIQHEVDHLNGILTFHRVKSPEDIIFDAS